MKPKLYVPDFWEYAKPFRSLFDYTPSIKACDVIMLTGGSDISPAFYHEPFGKNMGMIQPTRDIREKQIYEYGVKNGKRFLGICRGAQFLCVMSGGSLVQHITGHHGDHRLATSDGQEINMSSSHHQMLKLDTVNHELLAWTEKLSDTYLNGYNNEIKGIEVEPEIVYFKDIKSLGIQGHPEYPFASKDETLQYLHKLVQERLLTQ